MNRTNITLLICLVGSLAFTACNRDEQARSNTAAPSSESTQTTTARVPPAQAVRAEPSMVEIAAGSAGEAIVRVSIAAGYHINANPPSYPYLKATQLEVASTNGITAGQPTYPAGEAKKFAFDEKPLAVYEGEAMIKLPLTVDAAATKGARSLSATLQVQACDDQACFPPRKMQVSIPVTIK